jgi:hypothetical protein
MVAAVQSFLALFSADVRFGTLENLGLLAAETEDEGSEGAWLAFSVVTLLGTAMDSATQALLAGLTTAKRFGV